MIFYLKWILKAKNYKNMNIKKEHNEEDRGFPKEILLWGGATGAVIFRPIVEYNKSKVGALINDDPDFESPFSDINLFDRRGLLDYIKDKNKDEIGFIVTIGNDKTCEKAKARREISEFLIKQGLRPVKTIHHTAFVDKNVEIGEGIQILAGAKVISKTKIGNYCIINTGASVDHECILEDGSEVGPGAVLCGCVYIGENSWVGANATVLPRIKIGANSVVGAGAVVTKDIPSGVVVIGNPARELNKII